MKKTPRLVCSLGIAALPLSVGMVNAQTTWIGGTDLNWSTAANWSPSTAPTAGITALLGNTGADRTVVYDASASGTLGTLTFTQTSAFLNALDVQKNLTVTNAITLAASGGGTAQLSLNSTGSNRTLTASGGIDIQSGGKLVLNFGDNIATGSYAPTVTGNVSISGGTMAIGALPALQTSGSTNAIISGALTISSGSITIDNGTKDLRLQVSGNFTATGGSLTTTGTTKGLLDLGGATNSMSNFTMSSAYGIQLSRSGDQTLTGLPTQTGLLYMRGSGTKTVGSASGATVGSLQFINTNTNGTAVNLKLSSNLTQATGTQLLQLANGAASGTNTALGVDTAGYVLDMTQANGASGLARGTNGVWKPNHAGSATGTTWALTSSTAGGRIKALGYDFTGTSVTVTVGAGLTLEATGGNGIASSLGSGTALDSTSVFLYSGGASSSNAATLSSGRSIGVLQVQTGALAISGSSFTAAGGIQVASGGLLDFTNATVSAPTVTIGLTSTGAGQIKVANGYSFSGNLVIDISSYNGSLSSYTLYSLAGATTGDFGAVSISGLYNVTLTQSASTTWSGSGGGYDFTFSEATGGLSVVASAIPEPSVAALVVGLAGFGVASVRRRRR